MQVSKRDQKLLIILAGILVLAAAYFFGYSKYKTKREEVQTQIEVLQNRYDGLAMRNLKRGEYQSYIESSETEIKSIASLYPSQVTSEKEVYFITQLEDATGAQVSNIAIEEPVISYTSTLPEGVTSTTTDATTGTTETSAAEEANGQTAEATGQGSVYGGFSGFNTVITVTFKSDYTGLKKMVDFINLNQERKTIDSFSVTYDKSSGLLAGTMTYNAYSTNSVYSTYEAPEIPSNGLGVSSILGTKTE